MILQVVASPSSGYVRTKEELEPNEILDFEMVILERIIDSLLDETLIVPFRLLMTVTCPQSGRRPTFPSCSEDPGGRATSRKPTFAGTTTR